MSEDLEPKTKDIAKKTQVDRAEEAAAETLLKETTEEITQEAIAESVIETEADQILKQVKQSLPSIEGQDDKNAENKETSKKAKGGKKPKKGQKIRSKKYQEKADLVEKTKLYPLNEAVETAKGATYSKFDGTFEIHINTNVKNLRGLISLPFTSGKKLTILAFGKDAADSGADIIGDESTITNIQKGKLGFDVLITTPEWMPKLAKVAAILGPRSLMPNPKSGTITDNLKKAVTELQGGKTEYKTEKGGQVIHLGIGKTSQPTVELAQNIKILLSVVGKSRIKKVTLSPSMGPAVRLDLSSI